MTTSQRHIGGFLAAITIALGFTVAAPTAMAADDDGLEFQFPQPVYTYFDSTAPVSIQLSNFENLPDDQEIRFQIGRAGATDGWHPLTQLSVSDLETANGIIPVPRSEFDQVGTYYVEASTWGLADPSRTVNGTVYVQDAPDVSFTEDAYTTTDNTDIDVTVGVYGYLPAGGELSFELQQAGETIFTADPIVEPGQTYYQEYTFTVPGEHLRAQFGNPNSEFTVVTSHTAGPEYPDLDVLDSDEAPLSASAVAPVLSFDKTSYSAIKDAALSFKLSGFQNIAPNLPITFSLTRVGQTEPVWTTTRTVSELLTSDSLATARNLLSTLGEDSYVLNARAASYYDEVVEVSAPVSVTAAPEPTSSSSTTATSSPTTTASKSRLANTGPTSPIALLILAAGLLAAGISAPRIGRVINQMKR